MFRRTVVASVLCLSVTTASADQGPQRPGAIAPEEAGLVAEGWTALAARDLARAAQRAATALGRFPRSLSALQLTVEVDIEQRGAAAALGSYEQWLAGRTVEEPSVLRRIAHAMLREAAASSRDPGAKAAATAALAADGDRAAQEMVEAAVAAGSRTEVELQTRRRNPLATAKAIESLKTPVPNKMALIDAVGQSGNALAVPALVALLQDPRPEHRAAAAEALGRLDAKQTIPLIRPLLAETAGPPNLRMAAAGALVRLGDDSGVAVLRQWLSSPVSGMRAGAAKALAPRPDALWAQTVRGLADDTDPTIRVEAVELLWTTDPAAARVTLGRLLADADPAIRELAGRVAAGLDLGATGGLTELRAILRLGELPRVTAASRILEYTR